MKATRRTVLGWLLAVVIAPPLGRGGVRGGHYDTVVWNAATNWSWDWPEVIYLDLQQGSDANSGSSPAEPLRSVAEAYKRGASVEGQAIYILQG